MAELQKIKAVLRRAPIITAEERQKIRFITRYVYILIRATLPRQRQSLCRSTRVTEWQNGTFFTVVFLLKKDSTWMRKDTLILPAQWTLITPNTETRSKIFTVAQTDTEEVPINLKAAVAPAVSSAQVLCAWIAFAAAAWAVDNNGN